MIAKMSVDDVDVGLVNPSDLFGDVRYARLLVSGALVPVNLTFKSQDDRDGGGGGGDGLINIESAEYLLDDALWLEEGSARPHFKGQLDGYFRRLGEERLMRRLTMGRGGHYLAEILRDEFDKKNPKSRGLILRRSAHRDAEKRRPYKRFGTYEMSLRGDDDDDVDYYGDGSSGVGSEGDDGDEVVSGSDTSRVNAEIPASRRVCYPFDVVEIKQFWLV